MGSPWHLVQPIFPKPDLRGFLYNALYKLARKAQPCCTTRKRASLGHVFPPFASGPEAGWGEKVLPTFPRPPLGGFGDSVPDMLARKA